MPSVSTGDVQDIYRMTPMQEGMFFHALEADPGLLVEQVRCRIAGAFDFARFASCWQELFRRHATLRSKFVNTSQHPVQVVLRDRAVDCRFYDLSTFDPARAEQRLAAAALEERHRRFDLGAGDLVRVSVTKVAAGEHELSWTYHHIVMDGWSAAALLAELVALYSGELEAARLRDGYPELDTAHRACLDWLEQRDRGRSRAFWSRYLADFEAPTSLPRASVQGSRAGEASSTLLELGPQDSQRIQRLAADAGVTVSTLVQACWATLLQRCSGRADVVFGVTVSTRPPLAEAESVIGLFINTLPLRVRVSPDESLIELAQGIQSAAAEWRDHAHCPLVEVQAQSPLRERLFDHILVFQNFPSPRDLEEQLGATAAGLRIGDMSVSEHSNYPFSVVVTPGPRFRLRLLYHTRQFSDAAATRIQGYLERCLVSLIEEPSRCIGEIPLLPEHERRALLSFNPVPTLDARSFDFSRELLRRAERSPDAIAVAGCRRSVSYAELLAASAELAGRLMTAFVTPAESERVVAVCAPNSVELVIALVGVLHCGAAFLYLDPTAPAARNERLLINSGAEVLLADDSAPATLRTAVRNVLSLDAEPSVASACDVAHVPAERLAYLIATSGSTGEPKLVAVTRGNFNNYLSWCLSYYFATGGGDMPLFTSLSFDLTLTSVFCPLALGRRVAVVEDSDVRNCLLSLFGPQSDVDTVKMTPAHVSALAELDLEQTPVGSVILGGEAVQPSHLAALLRLNSAMRVFNEYGPTETTVGSSVAELTRAEPITAGRPIANTRVYVMDEARALLPLGSEGEICIGGLGVARGYHGRPSATAAAFVACDADPDGRVYRTGDLGRWLEDGRLIVQGRRDDQVKIRGHRVELGEVEAVLAAHPAVRQVAALALTGVDSAAELAACVVCAPTTASPPALTDQLRAHCASQLPEAMVPTTITLLERLPLRANGKVDRRALSAVARPAPLAAARPPSNDVERKLLELFGEVLGSVVPSVDDDFFRLGGHSLRALALLNRIKRAFGRELPVRAVFDYPTVRQLAERLAPESFGPATAPFVHRFGAKTGVPVIALPPLLGSGLAFRGVAERLEHHPLWCFDFVDAPDPVGVYASWIRQQYPTGSLCVLGYSAGGNLGFELVQRLELEQRRVEKLILWDSVPRWKQEPELFEHAPERVAEELEYYTRELQSDADLSALLADPEIRRGLEQKMTGYLRYLSRLAQHGIIRADIHVLRSEQVHDILTRVDEWPRLTRGRVHHHIGSGRHGDMLLPAHLSANARATALILEGRERRPLSIDTGPEAEASRGS